MIAAAFLDRDGTLIEDTHYPRDPSKLRWLDNAVEGMRAMVARGYHLFVVSNQSGVGRGLITHEQFLQVHMRFGQMVSSASLAVEEYFYCLDAPERRSPFRKPLTGMIPGVWKGQPIDLQRSFVVGDRLSDLELGWNLDLRANYLVRTGLGAKTEAELSGGARAKFFVSRDLLEIANKLPPVV
jgi:D-glycero-D-manno-heptose 1,7-bisphosphate phosphatase